MKYYDDDTHDALVCAYTILILLLTYFYYTT